MVIQGLVSEWRVSTTAVVYSREVTVNQEFTGPVVFLLELFRLIKFAMDTQTARLEKTRNTVECGIITRVSRTNRLQLLVQSNGSLFSSEKSLFILRSKETPFLALFQMSKWPVRA